MQKNVPFSDARIAKYPEPVHIVLVKGPNGIVNPMSASWVMFTSIDPPMLAVSIGFQRYTYELIKQQNEFVICVPSETMAAEVKYFGSHSGQDIDKLAELDTPTQATSVIDGILLSEASANYECCVSGSLCSGDHMIFTGEIVATHINEKFVPRLFVLEPKKFGGLRPLED
ncbi:MAG: flavin reductase family protein [Candidatus Marinimicrobia bacterium]|nr:flavin reductase family protein [Candidatus Neomarinimicrobiota bacterium]